MAKKAESDDEFLSRINKLREDSLKKIKEESNKYTKEYEAAKQQGKETTKIFTELEECEKIAEEFKKNPPVVISKHINGISVEYVYEDKYKDKIEKLKKHNFCFRSAVKDTSIFAATFKTTGNVYIKRSGKKIILPQSSLPPVSKGLGMGSRSLDPNDHGFVLEDNDLIVTEKSSYITIADFTADDNYRREIFVYPNSQLEVNITKKESAKEMTTMSGEKLSDEIKKNSCAKVIEYNFNSAKLISGIFKIDFLKRNKDINPFLKYASGYPSIEFLSSQHQITSIVDKEIAKMQAKVKAMYLAKANHGSKNSKVCDEISGYVELCDNKSIVVFGTGNSVKNKSSGKTASIDISNTTNADFMYGKIIAKGNDVFSGSPDSRVKAIIKNKETVEQYNIILETKNDYELKLKEIKARAKTKKPESPESLKEKTKRIAELKEQLGYYKKVGDNDMVMATQMQLDEFDSKKNAGNQEINEETLIKMIAGCNKELAKLKPSLDSNFPSYS